MNIENIKPFDRKYSEATATENLNLKHQAIKALSIIPGIGKSLANDFWCIGIKSIADLKGKNPQILYDLSNNFADAIQDRCVLYAFRCAVYYANTPIEEHENDKLKWWNWTDKK